MAKIFGIQLKNVKQFTGWEGYGVNASVYLDGKRIGTFNDRADGGPLDLDCDTKEAEEALLARMREYFKANPEVDSLELWQNRKKYKDGNYPYTSYEKKEDEELMVGVFFGKLQKMLDLEKLYKQYAKKYNGFAIVDFDFIHTGDCPIPRDSTYVVVDKEEAFTEVRNKVEAINKNYTMDVYRTLEDFEVVA